MRSPLPPLPVTLLVLAIACTAALEGWAQQRVSTEDDRLLPVPGLLRPGKSQLTERPDPSRCAARSLPPLADQLPFGPGEQLSFRVSLLGFKTGTVALRIGERRGMDGVVVYPLHAQVQTEGILSVLGTMKGRMVSWLDPNTLQPVRMVNRFTFRTPFRRAERLVREDAAFGPGGNVVGRLLSKKGDDAHTYAARARATADLLDVVSVIYYARARDYTEGTPFCFEIFHRRRLWRVQGTVGPSEVISPPFGARRARRIDAQLRRVGLTSTEPREVTAWVSEDDDRLPLRVQTPDYAGTLEVSLVTFVPGRRLRKKVRADATWQPK